MEGTGLGNWIGPFKRGPEGDKFKHDELFASSALLLGRRTYDGFAAVWPTVKDETGFAARVNGMPKYVVSNTMKTAEWNNSTVLRWPVADEVRKLRAVGEGDLLVYGGAAVVHELMPHGLIDELRLMVYPTVLGRGRRLFPEGVRSSLGLVPCKQLGSGVALLRYASNGTQQAA